jgi:Tfp pilus assembly protein PilN
MIRINLLPTREVAAASSRRQQLVLAGGIIACAFAVIVVGHFFQAARLESVNTELEGLQAAIVNIRKQNQELEKMAQQRKDLEEKIRVARQLLSPERRAAAVHILDDLSASTPADLWLTDFTEINGAAKINGKAVDNQTIAAFARNLSDSPYFRNVEIRETAKEIQQIESRRRTASSRPQSIDSPQGIAMTRFLIEASLNYRSSVAAETSADEEKPADG